MATTGHLPAVVERYLERALPASDRLVNQVQITQEGEMFKRPGARAMRFQAVERFAVDRLAFWWQARFPVGPFSLRVRDGYSDGGGALVVRALGLPLQRESGHDVTVGEAYRYLAELPWAPYAIASNRVLRWREVDDRAVEVSTMVDGELARVRIEFGTEHEITHCVASARPRSVEGKSVPTPWGGDLSDYRTLGGMWMPTRGEVYWHLPEGRFVYWRGHLTSAEALSQPFNGP